MKDNRITLRAVLLGSFFAALFAGISVYVNSDLGILLSPAQISVLPFLLLIVMLLLLNPLLRLIRVVRAFSMVELMIIFIMGMVSAGIPHFGLVEQAMPMIGSVSNQEWNNPQSEWNRYVIPFINDSYYVSVPGLQAAAVDYHQQRDRLLDMERRHRAAGRVIERRVRAAQLSERLLEMTAEAGDSPTRAQTLALRRLRLERENVRDEVAAAELAWEELADDNGEDMETVLRDYPGRIAAQGRDVLAAQAHLGQLEEKSFAKVELYRRGLPRGMSAYPGIFPLPQDDAVSYFARLRRLREGRRALSWLLQARDEVDRDIAVPRLLLDSEEALAPLADVVAHEARIEMVREEDRLLLEQYRRLDVELQELNIRRRGAMRSEAATLERDIGGLTREIRRVDRRRQNLRQELERWHREHDCAGNIEKLIARIAALRSGWEDGSIDAAGLRSEINAMLPDFAAADMSLRRYFVGEVPWHHWARPMARWAVLIALSYIVMMALNVLIFRQWAHNEMIIYPLAELPKSLVYSSKESGGIPDIFRNPLFWIGVAVSGSVMGWNVLCMSQVLPGLTQLDLRNPWGSYVVGTPFSILSGMRSEVFFTMVGLAFLIPKNVSFSLWFFYLLYMVQLLLLYWGGFIDRGEGSAQWWYLANMRTSQGAGAMFVFAAVLLFKCRGYILCAFTSSALTGLDGDERRELRIASWTFLGASLGIVLQLWLDMGANLLHTIYFFIMLVLMIIALIRMTVETGMPALQTWINPYHPIRAFFGFHTRHFNVSLFTPLLVYAGALYLDIKAFIAPAMANAIKLRDDFHMRRGMFHLAVGASIVLAVVVAAITSLMMCYDRGADSMNSYFYSSFPRSAMDTITSITKNPPEASMSSAMWMLGGGVFTALIIYLRQFFFWVPHPIGMVMLVNPIMRAYWFSIFLGWLANSAITKYGHKETYSKAIGFFIGLIVGEILLVLISIFVSVVTGTNINISLNRN